MTEAIRILLTDDHKVVREGLRTLLGDEPDFRVVGEAESGESTIALTKSCEPDLIVLDIVLPDLDGIEVIKRLRKAGYDQPVLVLSMQDNAHTVNAALRAGASGYVLKGEGIEDLSKAIREIHSGGSYLSPELSHLVQRDGDIRRASDVLSPREREILILVAEGFTARQIAARLELSPKTVENHRANIMDRLGVRTIASLVRYAMREGLTQ